MYSSAHSSAPVLPANPVRDLKRSRRASRYEGGRAVAALGFGMIILGAICNERLLGFLFAPDGVIEGGSRDWIRVGQTMAMVAGLILFARHQSLEAAVLRAIHRRPNLAAGLIGMVGVLGIFAAVELGFHALNTVTARHRAPVIVSYSAPLWQLGVTCESRKTLGDREIYNVTYHRDETGARVTPDATVAFTGKDIVFFGGSFTFGQGVEDDETLPNQVAQRAPEWRVTNFGYPGQGPAQMLQRIEETDSIAPFAGSRLIALDIFIPDHVRRSIGSMRIATTWGKDAPYFAPNARGDLELRGTMTTGRPMLTSVYQVLAREPVMKHFSIDLPIHLRPGDLAFTTQLAKESRDRILHQNPDTEFRVVLFPNPPHAEFPAARLIPFLQAAGIGYLDYSDRLRGEEGLWIPGDGHPTAKAYARVAEWIAEDFGLQREPSQIFRATD